MKTAILCILFISMGVVYAQTNKDTLKLSVAELVKTKPTGRWVALDTDVIWISGWHTGGNRTYAYGESKNRRCRLMINATYAGAAKYYPVYEIHYPWVDN